MTAEEKLCSELQTRGIVKYIQTRFPFQEKEDVASICYITAIELLNQGLDLSQNSGIYSLRCFSAVRDFYCSKWEKNRDLFLYENSPFTDGQNNPISFENLMFYAPETKLVSSLFLAAIISSLSDEEQTFISLKLLGLSTKEICEEMHIGRHGYAILLQKVKETLCQHLPNGLK